MVFSPNPTIPSDSSNEVFPRFNAWSKANPELSLELKNVRLGFLADAEVKPSDGKKEISYKNLISSETKIACIAAIIITLAIGIFFISGFLLGRYLM